MVIHSATCTDQNLKPLGLRSPDFKSDLTVNPSTLLGGWAGFASVFNADILSMGNMLRRPINHWDGKDPVWHDRWIYLLANVFGEIACISQSLVLYRRHANAVTGLPRWRKGFELSAGTIVCAEARLKEQHCLEWSKILAETPFAARDLTIRARAAAKTYARVAGIHRRRKEMYETPENAFSLLAHSWLKGDYGRVGVGSHRARDLFLDVYRLLLHTRSARTSSAASRSRSIRLPTNV